MLTLGRAAPHGARICHQTMASQISSGSRLAPGLLAVGLRFFRASAACQKKHPLFNMQPDVNFHKQDPNLYYVAIKEYEHTPSVFPPRRLLEKLAMRSRTEEDMQKLKEALEIYRRKRVKIEDLTCKQICRWLRKHEIGLNALMEILPQPQKYRVFPDEPHIRPVVEALVAADRCDDGMVLVKLVCQADQMGNPKLLEQVAKLGAKKPSLFPEILPYFRNCKSQVVRRKVDRIYTTMASAALKNESYEDMLQILDERTKTKPETEGSLSMRILGLTHLKRLEEAVSQVPKLPAVLDERKLLPTRQLNILKAAVEESGNAQLKEKLAGIIANLEKRGFGYKPLRHGGAPAQQSEAESTE